jgi:hypothetical protein
MLANAVMPMAVITLWFAAASISLSLRRQTPGPSTVQAGLIEATPSAAATA